MPVPDKLKVSFSGLAAEAGCDEAGRGCLAGPVFAAAVILPRNCSLSGIDDSKKLTARKRNALRIDIEKQALAFSVSSVSHEVIDKINILNASVLAMHQAIDGLKITPEFLIIDGNRFKPYKDIPYQCIVDGDALYMSIAAASILAKTWRDEFIEQLHHRFPQYGWNTNKGYGTPAHLRAIQQYGLSPFHRRSFNVSALQQRILFD